MHERIVAINGITVQFSQSEFIAILGPSGSGKSTLINMICGIIEPTVGEIRVLGKPMDTIRKNGYEGIFKQKISVILQNPLEMVYGELNFMQNLKSVAHSKGINIERKQLSKILERFKISHLTEQKAKFSSLGEQMRLAIAMAVLSTPEILILDEPTGMLDNENAENIVSILKSLNEEGMTILAVSHDPRLYSAVSQAYLLEYGRISALYEGFSIQKERLSFIDISVVDPKGFVRIPQKIIEKLGIETKVAFELDLNNQLAILKNLEQKKPPHVIDSNKLIDALKTIYGCVNSRSEPLLKVSVKKFPSKNPILQDINFEIAGYNLLVIMGPSGSGKSTLLSLLAGEYGNSHVSHLISDAEIMYLPHEVFFHPFLTIRELIASNIDINDENVRNSAIFLLNFLEVREILDQKPLQLSGGQKQRIALLLAIIKKPRLLLIDEPTSNLDAQNRDKVKRILNELSKNRLANVIMATHDPFCLSEGNLLLRLRNKTMEKVLPLDAENVKKLQDHFFIQNDV